MSRKHFDMHVSSYTPTGYAQYMVEMERIKHQLQIGKEYDLYTAYSTRNGKKSIWLQRTLVRKQATYAVFKSRAGLTYSYSYGDLLGMMQKPDGEIIEERDVYLSAYD